MMLPNSPRSGGLLLPTGASAIRIGLVLVLLVLVSSFCSAGSTEPQPPKQRVDTTAGNQQQAEQTSTSPATVKQQQQPQKSSCQYERGQWRECTPDGFQIKVQRLKSPVGEHCEPSKTIRRDCKPVGCKYARGQWSSTCQNGQRVRVDRLLGELKQNSATSGYTNTINNNCTPLRRVTKDCHRTCHYLRSAWSECAAGLQTRNLTLAETGLPDETTTATPPHTSPQSGGRQQKPTAESAPLKGSKKLLGSVAPPGQDCAKVKQVMRECRATVGQAANLAAGGANGAPSSANSTLGAQRRRSKLLQQRQQRLKQRQQHHQQQTSSSSEGTSSTAAPSKRPATRR